MTAISVVGGMLDADYERHALLAGTFIALASGLVGYFVVLRNQVFTGDALSHVALTGALGGYAAGIQPLIALYTSTIGAALGMGSLGGRGRGRDVVIGTVFAWILGLGVLFLSIYTTARSAQNGAAGVTVLFGSIYGISLAQAITAAVIGAAVAACVLMLGRPLLLSSIDPDAAAARGVPVRALGLAFMALVGLTVAEAVQAVGALLLIGLLVTPAATAQRLCARPFVSMALATGLAVASLWAGLALAYRIPKLPPSSAIVAVAFATYVVAAVAARRGRGPAA